MQISTIGLDLAKHWFQVGVDAIGHVVAATLVGLRASRVRTHSLSRVGDDPATPQPPANASLGGDDGGDG